MWDFAVARRAEIDRHFAHLRRERPALWNGRVLLLHRSAIRRGVLRGACFETDYASFIAWRDWGFVDGNVANIFAVAALQGADGGYLAGEMAPSTANAGQVNFPCGTPDPADVRSDGTLDLAGSLARELFEETGIDIATLEAETGWTMVHDRGYIAMLKRVTAPQSAEELRARIFRHLARDEHPEFIDIRVLRGRADLNAHVPAYLVAYLHKAWQG